MTAQEEAEAIEIELELRRRSGAAQGGSASQQNQHSARFQALGNELESAQEWERDPNRKSRTSGGLVIDMALEGGIPAIAQGLASPLTPAGQAVVGAVSSAVGNVLAQGRRMATGEQEDFSLGQLGAAGATGAVPFAGPAANIQRVGAMAAAKQALKTAAYVGAVGVGGENLKTLIDEGRLADVGTDLAVGGMGAIVGGAASGFGTAAANRALKGRSLERTISELGPISEVATPGMLMPESFAGIERRKVQLDPAGPTAQRVDQAMNAFKEGMQRVAPAPQEGADIFALLKPQVGRISEADKTLELLNERAIAANSASTKAQEALSAAREAGEARIVGAEVALKDAAKKASDEALQANLDSALENARAIAAARAAGNTVAANPAQARDLMVDHVARPAKAAIDKRAEELFAPFDADSELFGTEEILEELNTLSAKLTAGLPPSVKPTLDKLIAHMKENPATSLQGLRNLRSYLREGVNFGEIGSKAEDRIFKNAASKVTEVMDKQAAEAFGEEGAEAFLAANKFYAEAMDAFDAKGVDLLFTKDGNDAAIKNAVAGIRQSGIQADEYRNLQKVFGVVKKFNPELASELEQQANATIKRSILHDVSSIDPSNPTALKVNGEALLKNMDDLGRTEGTLEALGLGNRETLAEMKRLFSKYPEASAMTKDQWDGLLSSPAFKQAAPGDLQATLGQVMAKTQVENQLLKAANFRAADDIRNAERAFATATATASDIGIEANQVRAQLEQLLVDPDAIAFNNPNLSVNGFNALADAFFNPASNKVSNEEVADFVKALRNSPKRENRELLLRLQERYIEDRIMRYHSSPMSADTLRKADPENIALFFDPVNKTDASSEIARANVWLEKDQIEELKKFGTVAKAIARYEKMEQSPLPKGSYNYPVTYQARKGFDLIADYVRSHQYNKAAKALANPRRFAASMIRSGERGQQAVNPLIQFGLGSQRAGTASQPAPASR